MDPRLQRRVQRYGWDKAADHYEDGWAAQLAPALTRLIDLASLTAGERVLDVACGTGLVSLPAATAVGDLGRVLGVDLSEKMVDAARVRSDRAGLRKLELARMDAEALTVPDASFDVALCSLGLMYVPAPSTALAEMHRALVPGGRVVVSVWGARNRCGWAEIFPIVDARVQSDVCPLFFQLGTGDALSGQLRDAGFVDVTSERLAITLGYASDADACDAAFLGGPVALAYGRFDDATRAAVRSEYLASIAACRAGSGYAVPGEIVIAAGAKR
jgi:ubiquinone/menaquinone biosynthesis C-methylase UbiE